MVQNRGIPVAQSKIGGSAEPRTIRINGVTVNTGGSNLLGPSASGQRGLSNGLTSNIVAGRGRLPI